MKTDTVYITEHAQRTPDKAAIIMAETGETVSFAELEARSNRAARLFRQCGLGHHDHMALLIENRPEFFDVCFGADRSGLYYTAISTRLTVEETAYIVNDSGARVLVTTAEFAGMAAELRRLCPKVGHFS